MIRFVLVVSAVALLLVSGAAGAPAPGAATVRSLDKLISDYMSRHGIPGLSAAVALDGRIIWSKGYGLADVENSVAAGPETAYRTCSMGKSMTATAAMLLVEADKLALDQPIQQYCPAFPTKPWAITSRHLLSHMSGIRHYGGPRDREEQTSTIHYASVQDALEPFKDDPLSFEPGTEFQYSTYGYDVLGCVIEGAARNPFNETMQRLVFEPSGMTHTREDNPSAIIPHRAAGYVRVYGELRNAVHVDMSNRLPAGGWVTTAPDLAAFAVNFIDCKLVSCATRDAMLAEQAIKNDGTVNYGLGWAIGEDGSGHPDGTAAHGGSSPGASGMLYIVPKRRLAVVVLSNLEDAPERGDIVRAIGDLVLGARSGR